MIEACDIYNPLSYLVLIFIAPFTIFYAYFSIGEKHSPKHNLMHFIPFLMMLCIWMTLELSDAPRLPFCYSINELVGYIGEYPLFAGFFLLLMLVFVVQVVTYFSMALRRFILIWKDYKLHGVSLRSLRMLIAMDFLFLIYPLTCVVYMSYYNSFNGEIFNLFVSVVITALSVLNIKLILPIRTDLSFMPVKGGKKGGTETRRSEVKENCEDTGLAERIADALGKKEMFRLPHLRLQDLAAELGTNRTYISDCINSYYGCSFSQLLIRYRINAAKELLLNSERSVQEIIEEVGFNTRSSFYKAFKENVSEDSSPVDWPRHNCLHQ